MNKSVVTQIGSLFPPGSSCVCHCLNNIAMTTESIVKHSISKLCWRLWIIDEPAQSLWNYVSDSWLTRMTFRIHVCFCISQHVYESLSWWTVQNVSSGLRNCAFHLMYYLYVSFVEEYFSGPTHCTFISRQQWTCTYTLRLQTHQVNIHVVYFNNQRIRSAYTCNGLQI